MRNAILALLLLCATGCTMERQWVELPAKPPEVPPANLPVGMRPHNWVSATGSGSCVIASSCYHLKWQNREDLAAFFRGQYSGGQTASDIKSKWEAAGIPFIATENGDPDFLDWASRTRRGAIIWYFPSHCVHFCGYSVFDGREFAMINDNNRERSYLRIPKAEFLRNWRGYGGFACSALLAPAPSLPHVAYQNRESI